MRDFPGLRSFAPESFISSATPSLRGSQLPLVPFKAPTDELATLQEVRLGEDENLHSFSYLIPPSTPRSHQSGCGVFSWRPEDVSDVQPVPSSSTCSSSASVNSYKTPESMLSGDKIAVGQASSATGCKRSLHSFKSLSRRSDSCASLDQGSMKRPKPDNSFLTPNLYIHTPQPRVEGCLRVLRSHQHLHANIQGHALGPGRHLVMPHLQ
mmetsp:Transcript_29502/g.65327  ORF Transcript_29502/g.65327 Transcript_29502/m.65327 type:complete len:210 (+) Transcript_29502:310-939(+)